MADQQSTPDKGEQSQKSQPAEKPVDQKAQEEAATERKKTGGYQ
ncbi:hypothetical protein [Pseudoroseomonas ludipueritiae]|nr:hypothetical protein [Pseudoroseomonas ludipueritiae]